MQHIVMLCAIEAEHTSLSSHKLHYRLCGIPGQIWTASQEPLSLTAKLYTDTHKLTTTTLTRHAPRVNYASMIIVFQFKFLFKFKLTTTVSPKI